MLVKPVYDAAPAHFLEEIGEPRSKDIARFLSRSKRATRCGRMLRRSVIRSFFIYTRLIIQSKH